jgi:hypothetical protein
LPIIRGEVRGSNWTEGRAEGRTERLGVLEPGEPISLRKPTQRLSLWWTIEHYEAGCVGSGYHDIRPTVVLQIACRHAINCFPCRRRMVRLETSFPESAGPGVKCPLPSPKKILLVTCRWRPLDQRSFPKPFLREQFQTKASRREGSISGEIGHLATPEQRHEVQRTRLQRTPPG